MLSKKFTQSHVIYYVIYKTAKFAPIWTTILNIRAISYTKPFKSEHALWHRNSNLVSESYFDSKVNSWNDYEQCDTKTIILGHFLVEHLLEKALPWQHLKSQMIKNHLRLCVIC